MKVAKIHRIISVTQNRWLKSYIDINTEQKKKASNAFEKDFFKFMHNEVFGKTTVRNNIHNNNNSKNNCTPS